MSQILAETSTQRTLIEPDLDYTPKGNFALGSDDLDREVIAEETRLIDLFGVWGIIFQSKCPTCAEWHTEDSVWGCVPSDTYSLEQFASDHGLLPKEA